MNAHSPTVADEALALAATNADILRAVRDGEHNAPGEIGHACGRPTKNMARDVGVLIREGLVVKAEGAPYRVTDAGAAALNGVDLAQGRIAGLTADPEAGLLLRHDQMRPNPLQPRKHFDAQEMEELKASIAADLAAGGPGVLQNLVVFPADADGVHLISAGDRRWRAVGELIAEGVWRDGKRLRAIERENSPGQVAFIALVENGQRANLTMMERARAYAEMAAETGLSARQCALQTGCDPRTVQEMLKVVREADPEDIAAHEAGERTWEWLRDTVKEHREAEAEPAQGDLEAAAEPHRPFEFTDRNRENLEYTRGHYAKLSPGKRLMLVELADKLLREPHPDWPDYTSVANDTGSCSSDVIQAGAGFMTGGAIPGQLGRISGCALELLRLDGLLSAAGDRKSILRRARTEAGVASAKIDDAEQTGRYITPWLDPAWKASGSGFGAQSEDQVDGAGSTPAPKPGPGPEGPHAKLEPLERLALFELAFKAKAEAIDGGWVKVGKYWLDSAASWLAARRFIVWNHASAGGPYCGITTAGHAWIDAHGGVPINKGMLTVLRQKAGVSREGDDYATPWLNAAGAEGSEAETAPASSEGRAGTDHDVEDHRAAEILARVRATLRRGHTAGEISELLAAVGLQRPFGLSDDPDEAGVVYDVEGDDAATADSGGQIHSDVAIARAELIAYALNFASGGDAARTAPVAAQEPLLTLNVGDLVSIGGEASAYRLLERLGDRAAGGHDRTAFTAQQVSLKTGKDIGQPRWVSLHAIQTLVPESRVPTPKAKA